MKRSANKKIPPATAIGGDTIFGERENDIGFPTIINEYLNRCTFDRTRCRFYEPRCRLIVWIDDCRCIEYIHIDDDLDVISFIMLYACCVCADVEYPALIVVRLVLCRIGWWLVLTLPIESDRSTSTACVSNRTPVLSVS